MKNLLPILALLTGFCHPASTPAQVIDLGTGGTTRAVVVGISDYQNLPDLQYAHRDAEAFAAWLQSKSGGSLPPENILLLLNGQATAGKVGMAFLWLVSESKEGDRAIVYFSGHGDVESKLLNQPGYLLCWDAPANVYMGSGSPSISDIQNVVGTLTLGNKAKVLFITDACRSGNLAGAAIDGVQITNNNLAKPFANEVKILSCQPNELSLEGVQWGGGRGVFSYNLLDGLYGLADRDSDSQVKVKEIGRYLEDMVSAQADPQAQNPMVIGDREALLAFVSGEDLAKIKDLKRQEQPSFSAGGKRGHGAALLAKVDTNLQEMYKSFLAAIESGHLMPSAAGGLSADDCYRMLIKEPAIQQLHGSMTRTLVAALADEAQQVVNKLLRTDPQIVDDAFPGRVRYAHLPAYLARAAEVLGEKHYMHRYLKCKQYFFEAKTYTKIAYPDLSPDSLFKLSIQALDKALDYDEDAAYVHLEKGLNYYWKGSQGQVSTTHFKRAMELSPQWVLALYYYGRTLIGSDDKLAVHWLKVALKHDSTFMPAYERLHYADTEEGSQFWRDVYIQKMEEFSSRNPEAVPAVYYRYLGLVLTRSKRYDEAEKYMLQGAKMTNFQDPLYDWQLGYIYVGQGRYLEAESSYKKARDSRPYNSEIYSSLAYLYWCFLNNPSEAEEYFQQLSKMATHRPDSCGHQFQNPLAYYYCLTGQVDKAERHLQHWLGCDSSSMDGLLLMGRVYRMQGKQEAARAMYEDLLARAEASLRKDSICSNCYGAYSPFFFKAAAHHHLGQFEQFQATNQEALRVFQDAPVIHYNLAMLCGELQLKQETLTWLEQAFQNGWEPKHEIEVWNNLHCPYFNFIRDTPEFKNLVKKFQPEFFKE